MSDGNYELAGLNPSWFTDAATVILQASEPWFAVASSSPWGKDEIRLKPLHRDYIRQLQEAGVITPAPEPTYEVF